MPGRSLLLVLLLALPLAAPCQQPCPTPENFLDSAEHTLLALLALTPVEATQAGYHVHQGRSLDTELDDQGPATLAAEHALLVEARNCYAHPDGLSPEDAADLALLQNFIDQSLFELDHLEPVHYRPQNIVEMIGSGLFFPLTETGGNQQERLRGVLERMGRIPGVLTEARANLREADPVFIDTALEETQGDIELVTQIGSGISTNPADAQDRRAYDKVARPAQAALKEYVSFLRDDLAHRPHTRTWRTGPENYARVFRFSLGPGSRQTPANLLLSAEHELRSVRGEMYARALPLHRRWFPGEEGNLAGDALENKVISEVIDRINDDHAQPAQLLPQVRSSLSSIRAFIASKDLVTLSANDNLKVVPTPAFLRGVFSVAGFHSAPPLDPTAEAEYWVTPIDPGTPEKQADSKLREYNNWMLQYLTMHEALPGHYTQFEHANALIPTSRRILRAVLANGAYAEGWGEYGVKEMEDLGYADHDPRFVLMVLKIRLRVIANAILDIRMQTMNMTDEEALNLMEHSAFQTHAEAMGKLRRAKLTAGQLPTYFVGFHQWIDLRAACEAAAGPTFSLKRFNDTALDEGPLPLPLLSPLLSARSACRPASTVPSSLGPIARLSAP